MIYNNTGSDQSICAVVGIDEPYVTPDDNLSGFKSRFILKGVVPDEDDHAQKFAILREPIPAGEVGRGVIVGTTPVLMQVEDEGDTSGTVIDGDTSKLISGNGGFANILWKQSGTGDKWAIVRLAGSGGGLPPIYKATADQSGNTVLAKLLLADGTLATGDAEELDVYTDAWKVRTDDLLVLTQDADGQPVAMPAQGCDNVFTVPAGSDDTADTTTWDISDQPSGYGGVTVEAFFRLYWSGTSGDPVYQFIREAKYDSKGALLYVGREVRSVAFDTDSCA
jgi:hypothetical protein